MQPICIDLKTLFDLSTSLFFCVLTTSFSLKNIYFRYYDKKSNDDSILFEGKKSYAEKRGHVWVPQNKRPVRLKENLKELEVIHQISSSSVLIHLIQNAFYYQQEHMSQQRIVLCEWRDCSLLQLMFSSGLFVNVNVNIFTGDPVSITFDKFLVGKLLSDYVADGKFIGILFDLLQQFLKKCC